MVVSLTIVKLEFYVFFFEHVDRTLIKLDAFSLLLSEVS